MKERREHPRYPARWRVAVLSDHPATGEADTLNGITGNVSMGGATIHSRYNFSAQVAIVLMLSIPPIHAGGRTHQLRIRGRTTYTVLDGSLNLFRTGVQFLELTPHDLKVLEDNLESRFSAFQIGGADKALAIAGR